MSRKVRYNLLGKTLTLAGLMAIANACHKDPTPEPQPNPQPTPIIPTKEITIDWSWENNPTPGWAPPKDSIKYYTDQDSVKYVFINIIGHNGVGFPVNCTGYEPAPFHRARDTLQTRIDIDSTKVRLSGSFYALNANATNHESGQRPGITPYDKEWFERHGMSVLLLYRTK